MVRQFESEVLKEASISQFLTRFCTRKGRDGAVWEVILAGWVLVC